MNTPRQAATRAFTLIELTVVVLLISLLAAMLVTASSAVFDRARKAQAKNDITQIVTAVNAFYTDYGKYPLTATQTTELAATFTADNSTLMNALRGVNGDTLNTRKIAFLSPAQIGSGTKGGVADTPSSGSAGIYYDPWGIKKDSNGNVIPGSGVYHIAVDADYSNDIASNPYGVSGPGGQPIRQGVIAWSLGKDGTLGKNGNNIYTGSDDIISWQ